MHGSQASHPRSLSWWEQSLGSEPCLAASSVLNPPQCSQFPGTAVHKRRGCFCICVPTSMPSGRRSGAANHVEWMNERRGTVKHGVQLHRWHMPPPPHLSVPAPLPPPPHDDREVARAGLELAQYHMRATPREISKGHEKRSVGPKKTCHEHPNPHCVEKRRTIYLKGHISRVLIC